MTSSTSAVPLLVDVRRTTNDFQLHANAAMEYEPRIGLEARSLKFAATELMSSFNTYYPNDYFAETKKSQRSS
ncbi:MAG: hypothetical protein FD135_4346 [Comamonadaceae bacterium]|nr:MAG: hypothetical protein FD135_4346 [Comamonadaceae bacterium]